jgi:hypothetical protein
MYVRALIRMRIDTKNEEKIWFYMVGKGEEVVDF